MYLGERLLNVLVYTVIGQFVGKRQSEENTLMLKMIKNKKFRKYENINLSTNSFHFYVFNII